MAEKPENDGLIDEICDSENRYRNFFNNNHAVMLVIDPETAKIVDANPAACKFYGYTYKELTSKKITSINQLEEDEVLREIRLAKANQKNHFLFKHRISTGEVRDVEVFSGAVFLNEKKLLYSIIHDVTERIKIEKELKIARFTLDGAPEAIFRIDSDGNIIYVNQAASNVLGYSADELMNKKIFDINPDYTKKNWKEKWKKIKHDKIFFGETTYKTKSGRIYPVEIAVNYVEFDGEEFCSVFARDITKRKKVEEALRKSEEKYRDFIEGTEDIVLQIDTKGYIYFANYATLNFFGMGPEECIGLNIYTFVHPDDIDETKRKIIKWIKKKQAHTIFKNRMVSKAGMVYHILWDINFHYIDDKKHYLNCIGRDITYLKKMERELLKIKKLESIRILAGGIAHDFNNVLTSLIGNISLAQMDLNNKEQVKIWLEHADKAAMKAKELANKLLTFSRGGNPVKSLIDVDDLLKNSCEMAKLSPNVEINYSVSKDNMFVKADETHIRQAICNILLNSDEAMPKGGKINIWAEKIFLKTNNPYQLKTGNYIRIAIRDNGPGIPESMLDKIFDPYFSTKNMGAVKGMGLGLSIAHSMIKKHGGNITVESKLGKGTSFYIYLPAKKETPF